jgi:hypothetical protein
MRPLGMHRSRRGEPIDLVLDGRRYTCETAQAVLYLEEKQMAALRGFRWTHLQTTRLRLGLPAEKKSDDAQQRSARRT